MSTKLRTILRYIGSCDGDMEKGNLRADVNVSVRRPGAPLGTRCEIKNVNSIRFIGQAIDVEARRQIARHRGRRRRSIRRRACSIPRAAKPARCARRKRRTTIAIFPTPTCCRSNSIRRSSTISKAHLPELPDAKKARFIADYGLSAYDAGMLVAERETADYYEVAVSHGGARATPKPSPTGSWAIVSAYANTHGLSVAETDEIGRGNVATLVDLIGEGVISGKIAKDVLAIIIAGRTGAPIRGRSSRRAA